MAKTSRGALQVLVITLAVGIVIVAHFAWTKPPPITTEATAEAWISRIPKLLDQHDVEGAAVLVLVDARPVASGAFGTADVAADTPLDKNAVIMAHSISKSVTAWGLMRLVHAGSLDLDAPVSRYVDDDELARRYRLDEMSVRQLASMDAGLPLGTIGAHLEPRQSRPSLQEHLVNESRHSADKPGSGFEYSNVSFAFLELIIENASGQDFNSYMRDEILEPLGMQHSSFEWQPEWQGRLPTGYDLQGDPVTPYVYPYRASGGLYSTLDDLGRFAAASIHHDPVILTDREVDEMHRSHTQITGLFAAVADYYGIGHFIEEFPEASGVWHGGQGLGWMTHFYVVPETGDGIVIVSNSQKSWPLFAAVLDDWASWVDVRAPGMALISKASLAIRLLVGWLWALSLWSVIRAVRQLRIRRRVFALGRPRTKQGIEALAALMVSAVVVWALTRDYRFVDSVFPQESPWLLGGLGVLAVALALNASTQLNDHTE